MICPECGIENAQSNRFCLSCGYNLEDIRERSKNINQSMIIAGVLNLLGGGATILGWLMPWFSFGRLANSVMRYLGLGAGLNLFSNLGSGGGSGLKLTLLSLGISFAALTSEETIIFGLLGFIVVAMFVSIPVMGGKNIKLGLDLFDLKAKGDSEKNISQIRSEVEDSKKRATRVFVVMVLLFIIFSIIPFASALLSGGFYVAVLGAVTTYLGARFVLNRIHSVTQ